MNREARQNKYHIQNKSKSQYYFLDMTIYSFKKFFAPEIVDFETFSSLLGEPLEVIL